MITTRVNGKSIEHTSCIEGTEIRQKLAIFRFRFPPTSVRVQVANPTVCISHARYSYIKQGQVTL